MEDEDFTFDSFGELILIIKLFSSFMSSLILPIILYAIDKVPPGTYKDSFKNILWTAVLSGFVNFYLFWGPLIFVMIKDKGSRLLKWIIGITTILVYLFGIAEIIYMPILYVLQKNDRQEGFTGDEASKNFLVAAMVLSC